MKNYITRTDAASILGVHPQTITNYANEGFFNILKTPTTVLVEKGSFEQFIERYSVAAKSNEEIAAHIEGRKKELTDSLADLENEANNYFKALSARCDYARSLGNWGFSFVVKLFDRPLVEALDLDNNQTNWCEIFKAYASGESRESICKRLKVSTHTLTLKMYRALLLLKDLPDTLKSLMCENRALQLKVAKQSEHICQLRQEIGNLQKIVGVKSILTDNIDAKKTAYALNILVTDYDFTVRTLNVLKNANVKTLQDMTRISLTQLYATRNCGKKTISEIREFLDKHSELSGFSFKLKDR